jgi:hypothetical protein
MCQHHRVVVHVDDPGFFCDRLSDLVRIVRDGKAGSNVEKLPDTGIIREEIHRAGEETPVGAHRIGRSWIVAQRYVAGFPVGGEVVLSAQPVVVDPSHVRHRGVKTQVRGFWLT